MSNYDNLDSYESQALVKGLVRDMESTLIRSSFHIYSGKLKWYIDKLALLNTRLKQIEDEEDIERASSITRN